MEEFVDNIVKPRLIINIYPKVLVSEDGSKVRVTECYALQLEFGARMLLVKQSLQDGLTAMLRSECGEPVWDDGWIESTIGLETVQRPGAKSEQAGSDDVAEAAAAGGVGADGAASEAVAVGAGAVGPGGAGGSATPPGAGGIPGGDDSLAGADDEMGSIEGEDGVLTKWLLITIPPLDLGLSRRGGKAQRYGKGNKGKGKGKGNAPAPGAVAKAAPTPPPSVAAPLGPSKARGKGSKGGKGPKGGKGKGKDKDKGKAKGKGQSKRAGGRPARAPHA